MRKRTIKSPPKVDNITPQEAKKAVKAAMKETKPGNQGLIFQRKRKNE